MKKSVKVISVFLTVLLVIGITLACSQQDDLQYNKDWIIGKTSAEIQENYGEFDQARMPPSSDGLYRRCTCSYFLTEEQVADSIMMFSISFDENGVAHDCWTEEGPIGG